VAELYLAHHAENDSGFVSCDGLATAFDQAAPELGKANPTGEVCVLAVPTGASGQQVRELAHRGITDSHLIDAPSDDDIILYREQVAQSLHDLKAIPGPALEAYRRLAVNESMTPHCRQDITDW
jgi:hypothetical protein